MFTNKICQNFSQYDTCQEVNRVYVSVNSAITRVTKATRGACNYLIKQNKTCKKDQNIHEYTFPPITFEKQTNNKLV